MVTPTKNWLGRYVPFSFNLCKRRQRNKRHSSKFNKSFLSVSYRFPTSCKSGPMDGQVAEQLGLSKEVEQRWICWLDQLVLNPRRPTVCHFILFCALPTRIHSLVDQKLALRKKNTFYCIRLNSGSQFWNWIFGSSVA